MSEVCMDRRPASLHPADPRAASSSRLPSLVRPHQPVDLGGLLPCGCSAGSPTPPPHLLRVVLLVAVQVQGSDVVLHIAVEHRLPELDVGPHHVLLHTAVGKLRDARAQFLRTQKTEAACRHSLRASLSSPANPFSRLCPWAGRRAAWIRAPPSIPCKLLDLLSADPGPNRDEFWKAESIRCWDGLPREVVVSNPGGI